MKPRGSLPRLERRVAARAYGISGADRQNHITGSQDWAPVRFKFEINEDREIEFVVELRADKGEAWFDLSTLKLIPH